MDNPFEVGRLQGSHIPVRTNFILPDKIYAVYSGNLNFQRILTDTILISGLIGKPGSHAIRIGLGMFMNTAWWGQPNLSWTVFCRNTGKLPKIEELLDNDVFDATPEYISYPVTGEFTKWLIETYGMDTYLAFFRMKDSVEGLKMAYLKSPEELDQMFREYLRWYQLPEGAMEDMGEFVRRVCGGQGKVQ